MNIYVASSWRNPTQPAVVEALREAGHDVYDFRQPTKDDRGFHWSEIDPEWEQWSPEQFRSALLHPLAVHGFVTDMQALMRADAVVLVMPCGRSAHLEFGFGKGHGKRTAILLSDGEPELMYCMADALCFGLSELVDSFKDP